MKNKFYHLLAVLVCAAAIVGCTKKSSSTLQRNDFLGNLPALYDAYDIDRTAAEKTAEQKGAKLLEGGEKNFDKIQKLYEELQTAQEARDSIFNADLATEMAAVAGTEIPVSYSTQLADPWFTATAKVGTLYDAPWLQVTINTKEPFTAPAMQANNYTLYLRLVDAAGATLEKGLGVVSPVRLRALDQAFIPSSPVTVDYYVMDFQLGRYAASRAQLAGVEFITKQEFNTLK
jgi:hypothetical protein